MKFQTLEVHDNVLHNAVMAQDGSDALKAEMNAQGWIEPTVPPEGKVSPASFLSSLGIPSSSFSRVFTPTFDRDVRKAGGDPIALARYGTFSPQAGEYYFATEEIARRFHSAEYGRLQGLLRSFDHLEGYPVDPQRIADLGGGTGIISMYLAARYPNGRVVVYDHSPRQLALGRRWAQQQNLPNVEYVQTSYRQLAKPAKRGDFDLVLYFYGGNTKITGPSADEQAAMCAMARMLGPNGVGVISGAFTSDRGKYPFEAIRRAGLGVDWRFTRFIWTNCEGKGWVLDSYIFVRRGMPHLGKNAQEDADAHQHSMGYLRKLQGWGSHYPNPPTESFRDGEVLLVAEDPTHQANVERIRLVQRDGWLLMEGASSDGEQHCRVVLTLAGIAGLLELVHKEWQRDNEIRFRKYEVHQRLQRFITFCRQHRAAPDSAGSF